jgi:hypothetical protein
VIFILGTEGNYELSCIILTKAKKNPQIHEDFYYFFCFPELKVNRSTGLSGFCFLAAGLPVPNGFLGAP